MKKLACLLGVSLILMGCSSNNSTGKPVQVSSTESTALSALSNLTGNQKSESSETSQLSMGSSESPLKAAILKK